MGRLARRTIGFTAAIAAVVGCNEIANIDKGIPRACSVVEDCAAQASPCRPAAACEQGECLFEDVPGGKVPCDTGLLGICVQGFQQCDAQGNLVGACEGQVPETERCDTEERDEDCDGYVNEEGAGCVCGDGYLSEGEECDDGGTLEGDRCSAGCRLERVVQLTAGEAMVCALLYDGNLKCWGGNATGQLGLGDPNDRGDMLNEMGHHLPGVDLGPSETVVQVSAGGNHTCALLSGGKVKCWGLGTAGRLGLGNEGTRGIIPGQMGDDLPFVDLGPGRVAAHLAAGPLHTCVILSDGNVKCWGHNGNGGLGLGDNMARGDGASEMGDNLPLVNFGTGKTAIAIAVGWGQTCVILNDHSVRCWGANGYGSLGLGDVLNRGDQGGQMGDALPPVDLGFGKTAVAISAGSHTCAILNDGSVKCWGDNDWGQLGLGRTDRFGTSPGRMGDGLPAVDLGSGRTAVAISAGGYHTCAILDDGSVKCWGLNGSGQLGLGDVGEMNNRGDDPGEMGDALPPVDLGAGKTAVAIVASDTVANNVAEVKGHTCALLNDGSVKCWGANASGQLGLGDTLPRGEEPGQMGDSLPTVKLFSDQW
jgi:cysteine-rich repeat protein